MTVVATAKLPKFCCSIEMTSNAKNTCPSIMLFINRFLMRQFSPKDVNFLIYSPLCSKTEWLSFFSGRRFSVFIT